MASDLTAADPARDPLLAAIARQHFGFGNIDRPSGDDRDFREVARGSVQAALRAAYGAGRGAGVAAAGGCVPDCASAEIADMAGRISNAIMSRAVDITDGVELYDLCCTGPSAAAFPDFDAARSTAFRIIAARARASVRTPSHAALSGAAAALALIEDAPAGPAEGEDLPDLFAVAEAARDLLRDGGVAPDTAAASSARAIALAEAGITDALSCSDARGGLSVALAALECVRDHLRGIAGG